MCPELSKGGSQGVVGETGSHSVAAKPALSTDTSVTPTRLPDFLMGLSGEDSYFVKGILPRRVKSLALHESLSYPDDSPLVQTDEGIKMAPSQPPEMDKTVVEAYRRALEAGDLVVILAGLKAQEAVERRALIQAEIAYLVGHYNNLGKELRSVAGAGERENRDVSIQDMRLGYKATVRLINSLEENGVSAPKDLTWREFLQGYLEE
jgi:hypothetical protein